MKPVVSVLLIISCGFLASCAVPNVQAKNLPWPDPMDGLDKFLKVPQIVMNTWIRLIAALTADLGDLGNAITLESFTLNHSMLLTQGNSSTRDCVLSGLIGVTKDLTLNKTSAEVVMNIRIPLATITGHYEMDVGKGLCTIFGCNYVTWKGNGSFVHMFKDVTIGLNYTLAEQDGRIQIQSTRADLNFSNCTLWAGNYLVNDKLQVKEDFEILSGDFEINFQEARDTYRLVLAESAAWAFNIDWGFRQLTVAEVMKDLEQNAGATIIE